MFVPPSSTCVQLTLKPLALSLILTGHSAAMDPSPLRGVYSLICRQGCSLDRMADNCAVINTQKQHFHQFPFKISFSPVPLQNIICQNFLPGMEIEATFIGVGWEMGCMYVVFLKKKRVFNLRESQT